MIYLDKFLHFISADGHHYKVPSSTPSRAHSLEPTLTVGGRPFAAYDPTQILIASIPLPLAYFSHAPSSSVPTVYNLSNVGRRWFGHISISDNYGSVSVKSTEDSTFRLGDQGMAEVDDPYFGYKVCIEFYDQYFQLKTTSDWIEWAYRDGDKLTHQLRQVHVTLSALARYVKIRYNCFQSSDVTDSGPHVDYTSDYINISGGGDSITYNRGIYFIFSEQIS